MPARHSTYSRLYNGPIPSFPSEESVKLNEKTIPVPQPFDIFAVGRILQEYTANPRINWERISETLYPVIPEAYLSFRLEDLVVRNFAGTYRALSNPRCPIQIDRMIDQIHTMMRGLAMQRRLDGESLDLNGDMLHHRVIIDVKQALQIAIFEHNQRISASA